MVNLYEKFSYDLDKLFCSSALRLVRFPFMERIAYRNGAKTRDTKENNHLKCLRFAVSVLAQPTKLPVFMSLSIEPIKCFRM